MRKLGLIAGGGALPAILAGHCLVVGRPLFVLRLRGFAGPELSGFEGLEVGVGELGAAIAALHTARCSAVCFAGTVVRPDFRRLKPDLRGLSALPGVIAAARRGDDGLLRFLVREMEKEGFVVEGAHQVMAKIALPLGSLGRLSPAPADLLDIDRGLEAARAIGQLDIGQAAVCCNGVILGLEAQEGTDLLLGRLTQLPEAIRGVPDRPRGVLVKAMKPSQEARVDLPTIGPRTIEMAARAGLRGIAGEADRLLVLERETSRQLADQLGLFVFGVEPGPM